MILSNNEIMQSASASDSPPPYDPTDVGNPAEVNIKSTPSRPAINDNKGAPFPDVGPLFVNIMDNRSGPSTVQPPSMPAPRVYRYIDPQDGTVMDSLLPPSHPDMVCMQNGHELETNYGLLGILAAVFWFPLGIGLCLLDRRVKCARCGRVINDGVCG